MLTKRLLTLAAISMLSFSCAQSESGIDNGTGGDTASGGNTGQGGATSSGGSKGSGGSTASGGTTGSGGSGVTSTGGTTGQGGSSSKGGTTGQGGSSSTGGATGHGGSGATGTGGRATGTGGSGTGGNVTGTGGATGQGGSPSTGGTTGQGGASTTGSGGSTGNAENNFAGCTASSAPLLSADNKNFPDPFAMHDGTRISSQSQWECRRAEIKADLEKYEIGPKQDPSTVTVAATYSGGTLTVKVTSSSGSLTLTSAVTGSGNCVVIGMNGPSSMVTGCTQVPFMHDQVVKYDPSDSNQYQTDPFYKVYPSLWGKIGNYSAWAWGISRIIDGINQVATQLKVDPTKLAVHGCSYAGKMALFGGALDERVALTVAEESGGGGINSWRTSQEYVDRTGMNIEKIDNTNFGWFMPSMQRLDPYKLPHDHHELIAMIAPRAVIALGNDGYVWLGDESGYKSVMAAMQVFTALGIPTNLGYDFTSNHNHCVPPTTQQNSVNAFVNRFLKGGTTSPNVAIKPPDTSYDLSYQALIPWTNPTLQ